LEAPRQLRGSETAQTAERERRRGRRRCWRRKRRRWNARRKGEIYASQREGGDRGIAWWQNARGSAEGERKGPRGRLKVAAGPHARLHTRIRARARPRAYARGIYTRCCNASVCTAALEAHGARARCSIDCERARARGQQPGNSAALLWRRYYVIAFVRRKNRRGVEPPLNRGFPKYTEGAYRPGLF